MMERRSFLASLGAALALIARPASRPTIAPPPTRTVTDVEAIKYAACVLAMPYGRHGCLWTYECTEQHLINMECDGGYAATVATYVRLNWTKCNTHQSYRRTVSVPDDA